MKKEGKKNKYKKQMRRTRRSKKSTDNSCHSHNDMVICLKSMPVFLLRWVNTFYFYYSKSLWLWCCCNPSELQHPFYTWMYYICYEILSHHKWIVNQKFNRKNSGLNQSNEIKYKNSIKRVYQELLSRILCERKDNNK